MASLNILEETSEQVFHTLTQIISSSFNVAIAFIQIIDDDDVFYANTGYAEKALIVWKEKNLYELIGQTSVPVIIEDIEHDKRSLQNDFFATEFELNFFAGIPLISRNNKNIGCVCLMHDAVRRFSEKDKELLERFTELVLNEYEIRSEAGIRFTSYQTRASKDAQNLADSNEGLYKSNEELERFIYITSHDLQEPVRKIKTFANLLKSNITNQAAVEKYADRILSSADRLGNLIGDLLNYSRITNSNNEFVSTNLNQVLRTVLEDFELIINQRNVTVEHNILPVLPVIPIQIYQLFSNLISNAIKFSTVNPVITINASEANENDLQNLLLKNEFWCISITDNGIGFDQRNADMIFKLFQRLNNNTEYPGTGIGLSICKRIIDNHHGAIRAISEPGKGSTFYIYLPKTMAGVD